MGVRLLAWELLAASSLTAFMATPASASDWYYVGTSGEGPRHKVNFVDKGSIAEDYSGVKKAWTYSIRKTLDSDGERKSKALWKFDCSKNTYKLLMFIIYGNNDVVIKSESLSEYAQAANYIVPDTVGETFANFVCKGQADGAFSVSATTPEKAAALFFSLQK